MIGTSFIYKKLNEKSLIVNKDTVKGVNKKENIDLTEGLVDFRYNCYNGQTTLYTILAM